MTALAPLPAPEPSAEIDLGNELDGLRRRADDQAGLLRKHQAAVTQLADSVAALVALGKKRNRWINLNSFVAYVLFTMLLGGAMLVLYRSRVDAIEARRAQAVAERDLARSAPVQAAAAAHDDATAAALYALVRARDDAGLIARAKEIETAALTTTERAVLTDAVAAARGRTTTPTRPATDDGVAAFKAGAWADAAIALERTIGENPSAPRVAQLRYYLGVARWKQGNHQAAVEQLEQALAGTLDASAADARYFYAASLDRMGDTNRARGEYDRFATAHPQHKLAVFARRRSAIIERKARFAAGGGVAPAKKPAPAADDATDPAPAATPDEPVTIPIPAPVEPPAP